MSTKPTDIEFHDLGLIDYKKAWDYQEKLFRELQEVKLKSPHGFEGSVNKVHNYLLFCEHPHVFTIGKSGSMGNILVGDDQLKKEGIEVHKINRGGDITYHGPGQIVGYPILDLENFNLGIKEYINLIEDAIIGTLKKYNIQAGRLRNAIGVWLDPDKPEKARKICAIGVRASRHITMHGFALNVNTDLDYYKSINPCGFVDKDVTSMKRELCESQDFMGVKSMLKEDFTKKFAHLSIVSR